MVPGDEQTNDEVSSVQDADAQAPADTGEANTPPAEPVHVPVRGSPGGVYRMVNGKRVRVQG